nr:immunoglobulin light chain junction region [Macaca mulatta]MOV73112.1 immunoglobulin light chain junction region [Macaca mulatta]
DYYCLLYYSGAYIF